MSTRPIPDQDPAIPPLGLTETSVILLSAMLPMALLAFGATPWLIARVDVQPGLIFWQMIVVGLIWQFVLALWLLRRERRHWTWAALKARLWLTPPIRPGEPRGKMSRLLWIVPLGALAVPAIDLSLAGRIDLAGAAHSCRRGHFRARDGDLGDPRHAGGLSRATRPRTPLLSDPVSRCVADPPTIVGSDGRRVAICGKFPERAPAGRLP